MSDEGISKETFVYVRTKYKVRPMLRAGVSLVPVGVNITEEKRNPNSTKFKCCSGFCVDLIRKFSADLSFDFALKRVKVSCDWWILTILFSDWWILTIRLSDWWIPTILVSDWSRTGRGAAS